MTRRLVLTLVFTGVALATAGCGTGGGVAVPGGDPARGKDLIVASGCGSCHTISGVDGADGKIGPSLAGVAERRTIAGRLENTPQNLTLWIREPQRVDPGNLMPGLGLSEADARDIAAYLDRH